MIQAYLQHETEKLEADFLVDQLGGSLGRSASALSPGILLHARACGRCRRRRRCRRPITGTLDRGDYVVDMLHYQSRPGLYVTGNLYRPARVEAGRAAAGHPLRLRPLGPRPQRQQGGLPVARHLVRPARLRLPGRRYAAARRDRRHSPRHVPRGALVVALARLHAGRRRMLERRPRHRLPRQPPGRRPGAIAVTGISGGGAATFWIAAADERVKVAVPVSGMADLESYVPNRVINGHCDCMFLYNTYPVALDADRRPGRAAADAVRQQRQGPDLPDGRQRADHQPAGAALQPVRRRRPVDSVVSVGGHAYRKGHPPGRRSASSTRTSRTMPPGAGQRSRSGDRSAGGDSPDSAGRIARLPAGLGHPEGCA